MIFCAAILCVWRHIFIQYLPDSSGRLNSVIFRFKLQWMWEVEGVMQGSPVIQSLKPCCYGKDFTLSVTNPNHRNVFLILHLWSWNTRCFYILRQCAGDLNVLILLRRHFNWDVIYYSLIFCVIVYWNVKKNKDIFITGHGDSWGCEVSKLPHFLGNKLTDGGEVVSLTHRPPIPPPP
jgi:hypothetical protein